MSNVAGRSHRLSLMFACWTAAAGGAQLAWLVEPWLAPVPVLLMALTAPSAIGAAATRPWTAVLLTATAVPFAPFAAWIVAAAGALAVLSIPVREPASDHFADLQRQLDRCRRDGDEAYVLVASVPDEQGIDARGIRDIFRLTDTVQVRRADTGFSVHSVVAGREDFSPAGLEQRMERALGERVSVGWARFPEAGATLDTLAEQAWANAAPVRAKPAQLVEAATPSGAAKVA